MTPINRLPKKAVHMWFWRLVNAYINPECYPPATFKRDDYLKLYAVMYDNGWLTDDELEWLDYEGLPEA